jgi:UDP-N-acetylglucosamine acyltransferase
VGFPHFRRVIHSTAIVHPKAKLDSTVQVGPLAVIDEGVELGPHCVVGPHVYLTGTTTAGSHNKFHAGCVIGNSPQDLKYKGDPSRLRIGNYNSFREHVTVNRATTTEEDTVIGSNCLLMASCHVGHNCQVGDYVIIANGALLGGHVVVADRAIISGTCLVHQFVHIGTLAMMQGGAAISKDLPPYTVARRNNTICGLNTVGLKRAGIAAAERLELRQLYRTLFRSGVNFRTAIAEARGKFSSQCASVFLDFIESSKRGVCFDVGTSRDEDEEEEGVTE